MTTEKSSSAGLEGKAKRRSSKTGRDENAAEKTGKKNARKIEAGVGKGLIRDRTNVIDVLDKAKVSVDQLMHVDIDFGFLNRAISFFIRLQLSLH